MLRKLILTGLTAMSFAALSAEGSAHQFVAVSTDGRTYIITINGGISGNEAQATNNKASVINFNGPITHFLVQTADITTNGTAQPNGEASTLLNATQNSGLCGAITNANSVMLTTDKARGSIRVQPRVDK